MRTLLATLALATLASAAPTHVVGTLDTARETGDYTPLTGYVLLSYQTFTAGNNSVFPAHTLRLPITAGRFDAWLEPGSYLLAWGNIGEAEYRTLTVPASSTAVNLAACLSTTPAEPLAQITLQQFSPSGAVVGDVATYTTSGWAPRPVSGGTGPPGSGGLSYYLSGLIAGPDTSGTITGATHGLTAAGCPLTVSFRDDASPNEYMTVGYKVDPASCDMSYAFGFPQTNYYVIMFGVAGAGAGALSYAALTNAQFLAMTNPQFLAMTN